jgi:hypothetical protein
MASLTGQTISSTYDGLLKTSDNDVLTTDGKEITDGLGNGSGVSLDTNGNIIAEGTIKAIGGIRDTSNDLGTNGQVLSSTGTGTNWVAPSIADDSVTYAKLGTEFTTSAALATNVDFSTAQVFTKTLSGATTLTFSNTAIGMVKDLVITGNHALTLPAGSTVAGTYDGTVSNLIQVVVTGASQYWFSISQAQ